MFLTSPPELKNQASLSLHGENLTGDDQSQYSQELESRRTDQARYVG